MATSVPISAQFLVLSLLVCLPLQATPVAPAQDDDPGQGSLFASGPRGRPVALPLRHTEVRADITAFVARVEVIQTFGNPFDKPLEVKYVFPLPERAAVDDFLLEVGDRRIRAEIHRREEARQIYQSARAAGHTASILDQERPNIFTQSAANIPPGEEVRIHLRYVDMLPFSDGAYGFHYPMVVSPRYSPPRSAGVRASEPAPSGPRYLKPGSRVGNDIGVTLELDAGIAIRSVDSVSHKILVTSLSPSRARVVLAPGDTIPNKDLMVRWVVAGEMPEVGVLAHRLDADGFFALLIQPKAVVTIEEAAPKEIIFVLDQSGSMSGLPIEMSKRFMRLALLNMGPRDRFNVVRFDSSATSMSAVPLVNTDENVRRGLAAVESMRASGGTEMLAGFRAAISQPHDPACVRIVFFLTDGFIGNEEEIFGVIREQGGDARIFTLGIGSAVNHHLLRGMADLGHGAYQYIRPDGREAEAVEKFQHWVTRPYLTDLEISWGSLRVEDTQPSRLPDLYSGQTLSVVGRYLWGGSDTVILTGRLGGVPWEKHVEVTLPERADNHGALASVWARQRIQELLMHPAEPVGPGIEAQVTSLALSFHLMSPFTSFVAVDDAIVVIPGGDRLQLAQSLPLPEFVAFEGIFGPDGPGIAEPLPLTDWSEPRGPTEEMAHATDSASPGRAELMGVVRDTDETGLPGVVLSLNSHALAASRQAVSDALGGYRTCPIAPAKDYYVQVQHPGYAPMEVGPLQLEPDRTTQLDITLRTAAEMTETIVVQAMGDIVEADAMQTASSYSAEFIERLPVIGNNYQDILQPGSGATEVITSGASAEYSRTDGGFANIITRSGPPPAATDASVDDQAGRLMAVDPVSIAESALHVLADLSDDGKLTRSEGLPALAGLLGAQHSDGGFSGSARIQALAIWALATTASSEPRLRWVPDAARSAADFLALTQIPRGLVGPGDDAWVDFALDVARAGGIYPEPRGSDESTNHCSDPRKLLEGARRGFGPTGARLIERILGRLP